MKILLIGLGSIGKRHVRILKEKYKKIYALRSGKNEPINGLGIKEVTSWEEVERVKPDVVFITNPTYLHVETAIKCAESGFKIFMEKPLGSDLENLDELIKIIKKKNIVSYVGYNLRFHPVISALSEYLVKHKPLHARVVCSSYLPNWRPGTDFLKSYSANLKMGGGVILDLTHEPDFVSHLFGEIKDIKGSFSKRGNITVDAEDYADMVLETKICPVNIHINFLSHLKQRYIQIDFEDLTVTGDILNCEIKEFQNERLRKKYKVNYHKGLEYEEELKYFFKNLNNPKMMNNIVDASSLFKKIILFKEGGLKIG